MGPTKGDLGRQGGVGSWWYFPKKDWVRVAAYGKMDPRLARWKGTTQETELCYRVYQKERYWGYQEVGETMQDTMGGVQTFEA